MTPWPLSSQSSSRLGHELEIVDPALFTSLSAHHPTPTSDDVEAAAQATANALEAVAPRSAKVRAVAHVRGVASLHAAQAWQAAHRSLRAELVAQGATESELVEAPPGKGWDFMVGTETLTFVSAVPAGHEAPRRRAELHAAANVGAIYQVRVMPDLSCTES